MMKVAMLLSGGVDSSTAVALLRRQRTFEITAFYLKIWLEEELSSIGVCPWQEDLDYVRQVCKRYELPLEIVPLQSDYQQLIVDHAIDELRAGRTPSPDILCNQEIKFGAFYESIGPNFDRVATGHYAGIERRGTTLWLRRSPDRVKDQTYFIYRLNQNQLRRAMFPVGHLTKRQVRELANEFQLPNRNRRDSQGLCFLGKIKYDEFVRYHLGERRGDIIDLDSGHSLGTHCGYWFYTIGQRQGLGLSGGPWYVVDKDTVENIIYVSHQSRYRVLAKDTFTIANVHWISEQPEHGKMRLKIRHGPNLVDCRIEMIADDRYRVAMAKADTGVAAGQSAVLYNGKFCLGGGTIE